MNKSDGIMGLKNSQHRLGGEGGGKGWGIARLR